MTTRMILFRTRWHRHGTAGHGTPARHVLGSELPGYDPETDNKLPRGKVQIRFLSFPTSPKTTRRSGLVKRIGCFISFTEWVEILEVVGEMSCVAFSCCVRCVRRVNCRFRWCFGYAVNGVVCTLGLSPRFLCGCDVIRFQDVRREGGLR